jgi:hypothetical protein
MTGIFYLIVLDLIESQNLKGLIPKSSEVSTLSCVFFLPMSLKFGENTSGILVIIIVNDQAGNF